MDGSAIGNGQSAVGDAIDGMNVLAQADVTLPETVFLVRDADGRFGLMVKKGGQDAKPLGGMEFLSLEEADELAKGVMLREKVVSLPHTQARLAAAYLGLRLISGGAA